jgi:hypothetical protein
MAMMNSDRLMRSQEKLPAFMSAYEYSFAEEDTSKNFEKRERGNYLEEIHRSQECSRFKKTLKMSGKSKNSKRSSLRDSNLVSARASTQGGRRNTH